MEQQMSEPIGQTHSPLNQRERKGNDEDFANSNNSSDSRWPATDADGRRGDTPNPI